MTHHSGGTSLEKGRGGDLEVGHAERDAAASLQFALREGFRFCGFLREGVRTDDFLRAGFVPF